MSKTFLFQAIQLSQKVLIQTIQFRHKYAVSSIQPIDRALSGATVPSQSGPGSKGNEGVLCISQSPSITGTSPSDCLVSYPGHPLGGGFNPLQRCSRCILQPQPTGQGLSQYSIVALVPCLPHEFSGNLFTNSFRAYIVFERSTDGEWHNPSGTSSDGQGGLLEQVAWVLATQKQKKRLSTINYLLKCISITIIYPIYLREKFSLYYPDMKVFFIMQTTNSFLAVIKSQERKFVRVYEQKNSQLHRVTHPLLLPWRALWISTLSQH